MSTKQQRYESLVQVYHKEMYRYALWLIKDQQIAEDVVQETFLRAWRGLDGLKDDKAAKVWLITILRRENARRFERKQLDLVDMESQPLVDHKATCSEQLMENELLRRSMARLNPDYSEPLIMQVLLGLSGDEIALQLGINKNTVMTRLFRAKKQLKTLLESGQSGQATNAA